MAIPLAYNVRNLFVRKTTTIMTALGIGLTVAVLVSILALVNGLRVSLRASADPLNIIVMRKGSTAELNSSISRMAFQDMKTQPGIARGRDGQPLASLEMVTVINIPSETQPEGNNVTVRGILMPAGVEIRGGLQLAQGRWFQPGRHEVVVGKSIAARYPGTRMGQKIRFGRGEWEVVGIMDQGKASANSEIFADVNQLSADYQRAEALSCARIRAVDAVSVQALINVLESDRRLNVAPITERAYYDAQTASAQPIQFLGIIVCVIMAVGSGFAAVNTMYAAVARRSREIGTLRVLGFSRASILLSFFVEGVLLSVLGGIVGCLLALPLNGMTTGIGNFATFSEMTFDFHIGADTMLAGIVFAIVLGAAGGLFPAGSAARKEILTALREV